MKCKLNKSPYSEYVIHAYVIQYTQYTIYTNLTLYKLTMKEKIDPEIQNFEISSNSQSMLNYFKYKNLTLIMKM